MWMERGVGECVLTGAVCACVEWVCDAVAPQKKVRTLSPDRWYRLSVVFEGNSHTQIKVK
jgi:hypothetical protein